MAYTILFRRGTANEWQAANPVLNLGELGFVTDTYRFKIGDGITNWNSLPYKTASLENGLVPLDQLPNTVKVSVNQVSTIAQRNMLEVQPGDVAIVAEEERTYIASGTSSASWVEVITTPDLTAYATEQYVDDSIDNLDLENYVTTASVSYLIDDAITELNLSQYATEVYVDASIADLDLPDSHLFQVDYQNDSTVFGNNVPHIGSSSPQFIYYGTTGFGEDVYTSSSAILGSYESASTVFYSTAMGTRSLSLAKHNSENVAVGYETIIGGGFRNVAVGTKALRNTNPNAGDTRVNPTTAKDNVAVGHESMISATTGSNNTAIGANALYYATTGNNNIAIGSGALRFTHDNDQFNGTNAIAIGASATVPANNTVKIGNGNHVVITDNPVFRYSDDRDMSTVNNISYGLDFINELRPVEFVSDARYGENTRSQLGFVASEVYSASPGFTGYIDFNSDGTDIKALAYDQFIPPVVKSIQELDTRLIVAEADLSEVDSLAASVAILTASVATLIQGEATYQTYSVSSSGVNYYFSASPGDPNPTVRLTKGRKYRFDVSGVNSDNPFAIRESDEITNYVEGTTGNDATNGVSGSSDSNYIFYTVPSIPSYEALIYQSASTSSMGGIIILEDPQ